jgi:hypothetical protein
VAYPLKFVLENRFTLLCLLVFMDSVKCCLCFAVQLCNSGGNSSVSWRGRGRGRGGGVKFKIFNLENIFVWQSTYSMICMCALPLLSVL